MKLMTKLNTLRIVYRDNGFLEGTKFVFPFLCQKYLKYPKKHIYSYNVRPLRKKVKLIHKTNIIGPATIVDIFGYRTYEKSSSGKIVLKLHKDSKVADIGAFIGDTAIYFAIQGAKVYSYEPQKEAYRLALENIKLNGLQERVQIYNIAVTSDGRKLRFDESNEKISGMFSATKENKNFQEKKSVSIKSVLKKEKFWDLLKIDIEGGEYELLSYLMKNKKDLKKIKALVVELEDIPHHREEINKFIEILKKQSYEVDYRFGYLGVLYAKKI